MATRVQKQTVWALWIKNLAEMLEPHLEIKHQGESKLWHPEPLAYRKLLHAMLHWENRRAANRHLLQTCLGDIWQPNMWVPSVTRYPPACGINQHSPLDRLTPPCKKKKKRTINKELKTSTQQRGQEAESTPEKERGQGADICINFQ
jgi:hypothetical protein